jgi:hypothetical protein
VNNIIDLLLDYTYLDETIYPCQNLLHSLHLSQTLPIHMSNHHLENMKQPITTLPLADADADNLNLPKAELASQMFSLGSKERLPLCRPYMTVSL